VLEVGFDSLSPAESVEQRVHALGGNEPVVAGQQSVEEVGRKVPSQLPYAHPEQKERRHASENEQAQSEEYLRLARHRQHQKYEKQPEY
jgi:hypothetical protein